ncbi:MAG: TIGR00297 family protein [Promethearchaeota archaeon]
MPLLDPVNICIALVVLAVLAIIAYKTMIVTRSGLLAAFGLGLAIWLLASWTWFFITFLFFAVTAQFTHYKYKIKRQHDAAQEKGGARDWSNVLANGGLPLIFVFLSFTLVLILGRTNAYGSMDVGFGLLVIPASTVTSMCFSAFLGALATATADTLATEIGLLNPTPPRLITKPWKPVPPGTSGGVSLTGELATFLGTLLIGGTAAILAAPFWITLFNTTLMPELGTFAPVSIVIVTIVGGTIGCTVDSVLGATIQSMWFCHHCQKQTEKRVHCSKQTEYLRGNRHLDNHMVNVISCLAGAITAASLYIILLVLALA